MKRRTLILLPLVAGIAVGTSVFSYHSNDEGEIASVKGTYTAQIIENTPTPFPTKIDNIVYTPTPTPATPSYPTPTKEKRQIGGWYWNDELGKAQHYIGTDAYGKELWEDHVSAPSQNSPNSSNNNSGSNSSNNSSASSSNKTEDQSSTENNSDEHTNLEDISRGSNSTESNDISRFAPDGPSAGNIVWSNETPIVDLSNQPSPTPAPQGVIIRNDSVRVGAGGNTEVIVGKVSPKDTMSAGNEARIGGYPVESRASPASQ